MSPDRYGLPDKAISDRGPQFTSHTFRELGQLLGIKISMSTAHHPQTNGATEWANQEIEAYLSIFCCNNPDRWRSLLPTLKFTYNSKPHATQKESPLFLQMGYNPLTIPPPLIPKPMYWTLKSDYCYCKKHEKKLMLHTTENDGMNHHLWLALLLTIHQPLSIGHCAQYQGFYYNDIVNDCRINCIWLS